MVNPRRLAVVAVATVVDWMLAAPRRCTLGREGGLLTPGYLRGLPKYQALVRRTRTSLTIIAVCFLIAVITRPPCRRAATLYVKHDKSASRDIVLCLDSSGSMLPTQIGGPSGRHLPLRG